MLLNVKPGQPCKLRRIDGEPGYVWDGHRIMYPMGSEVPIVAVLRSDWEVVPEPRFRVGDKATAKWEGNQEALGRFSFSKTIKESEYFDSVATVIQVGEWSSEPGIPAVRLSYTNGCGPVWVPESACELYKEPTVEEYVKGRGMRLRMKGTDIDKGTEYPKIGVDFGQEFTLETAKLACDLLEKLK